MAKRCWIREGKSNLEKWIPEEKYVRDTAGTGTGTGSALGSNCANSNNINYTGHGSGNIYKEDISDCSASGLCTTYNTKEALNGIDNDELINLILGTDCQAKQSSDCTQPCVIDYGTGTGSNDNECKLNENFIKTYNVGTKMDDLIIYNEIKKKMKSIKQKQMKFLKMQKISIK